MQMAFPGIKLALKRWKFKLGLLASKNERRLSAISTALDIAIPIASVATLVAMVVYMGYNLSPDEKSTIWKILRCAQVLFALSVANGLLLRRHEIIRQRRVIKWIVDAALVAALAVWIVPRPAAPWLEWLTSVAYDPKFTFIALGAYALASICYSISRLFGRRTNPSLIMAGSFAFFILLGSLTLMLPRCTYHGISYIDSLFLASSAVCITGLSPVDIPTTFTPFGISVLSVLVQLGSLGVLTFTSFFAMFFTGNTSIFNQLLLRDMIYSKSMNSLIPTLLYVLGFTLTIEALGAVAVFLSTPDALGLTLEEKAGFAAFHAMSSFCNAGFSLLPDGMANPVLMQSGQSVYVVTSVLIFAGAVGFPILVNLREILFFHARKLIDRLRGRKSGKLRVHIFDLNTKLVLYTTGIVLAIGSAAFFMLEYDNTLRGMSLADKAIQSVFNSLIPRSAGFASVDPNDFLNVTIIIILLQMAIGGSSQSMAGGVKVNTVAAIFLSLRSVARGHNGTTAFDRTINVLSIRRANAVVTLSIACVSVYTVAIMLLEPALPAKSAIFEVVSAFFTVGSSLGATPILSATSKGVLCTAMFLGRVGLLSMLCGVMARPRDVAPHLPADNIIIN